MAKIPQKHKSNNRAENNCSNEKGQFPYSVKKCKPSGKMKENAKILKT